MPRAIAARAPLSRDVVLTAAVALADERGLEGVSMRHLADALGVVPMALYKHVGDKGGPARRHGRAPAHRPRRRSDDRSPGRPHGRSHTEAPCRGARP